MNPQQLAAIFDEMADHHALMCAQRKHEASTGAMQSAGAVVMAHVDSEMAKAFRDVAARVRKIGEL